MRSSVASAAMWFALVLAVASLAAGIGFAVGALVVSILTFLFEAYLFYRAGKVG